MQFWTPESFREVTTGRWLVAPRDDAAPFTGVSIDSRTLKPRQVFLAIRGEKFDGHNFLDAATKAGAAMLIVDREVTPPAGAPPTLLVPDATKALQTLATAYRDVLGESRTKVIAVAGSNGKTTTRNLIHAVLSTKLKGTQSPKSFNNHLGVPLTLLGAMPCDDFVVVEVGTNHPGEIAALGAIVRPDAAVITSIGHEHMEFFQTLEGVAAEEAAILRFVRPGGIAIVCDDPRLADDLIALREGIAAVRFGESESCDPRLVSASDEAEGQRIGVSWRATGAVDDASGKQIETWRLPLLGRHNATNALAAAAVARWLGTVDNRSIAAGLAGVKPVDMRLAVQPVGGGNGSPAVTLINDAYNANPSSMAAAIRVLQDHAVPDGGRRVAILGDMFELGGLAPDAHRELGDRLAISPPDLTVFIGKLAGISAHQVLVAWSAERVQWFPAWSADLPAKVAGLLRPGDVVLIKASRGMGLERLVPAIQQKFGG